MASDFIWKTERFSGLCTSVDGSHELKDSQSPDMLNFKITAGGRLKRREGYRLVKALDHLRGIWYGKVGGKERFLAVDGAELYASETGFDSLSPVEGEVPGEESVQFFSFGDALYLLTGEGIVKYDGGKVFVPEAYVPTLMISTLADGSGVNYEEVNLLSPYFKQRFSPSGTDKNFVPALRTPEEVVWVKEKGELIPEDSYYWNEEKCALSLLIIPEEGIDTLEVMFRRKSTPEEEEQIRSCRYAVSFGGANDTRAFLYGNDKTPGMRYHSGMVDGKPSLEYFPATAYALIGAGEPITAIVRHYDRLLIWTETAAYYSYLEYMNGVDGRLVASFPVLPLSDRHGLSAPGQAVLVENDPCTVDRGGLFRWISTNIRDERNAVCVSDDIAHALLKEDVSRAILFNRRAVSEMYLCLDNRVYVYHYGKKEFYYYELGEKLKCFTEVGEVLYFASERGIFRVGGDTDEGNVIPVRWRTKKLAFGDGNREKNLYRVSLTVKSKAPLSLAVTLKTDDGKTESRVFSFFGGREEERRSLRFFRRRFSYLELILSGEEEAPIHLLGLEMQGRRVDRNV